MAYLVVCKHLLFSALNIMNVLDAVCFLNSQALYACASFFKVDVTKLNSLVKGLRLYPLLVSDVFLKQNTGCSN